MSAGPLDEAGGTRPSGPSGRSGNAARRRGASTRRPTTPVRPDRTGTPPPVAPETPATPALDPVRVALDEALAAIGNETVRAWVAKTRPDRFADDEWAEVADLVRLGIAAYRPDTVEEARRLRWVCGIHGRVQLDASTSRTVTGWYAPDVVEATLSATIPGVEPRSLATGAGKLRGTAARLVPPTSPGPTAYGRYDPHAPYSTAELTRLLDFAEDHPHPTHRRRLTQLLWLGLGAGPYDAELSGLTGASLRWSSCALLLDLPGVTDKVPARTVPVFHAAEGPLAGLFAAAGDGSIWPGTNRKEKLASWLVERARLPKSLPPLTITRLRTTWIALLVAADTPLRALLPATGVKGDRSFGHLLAAVPPMGESAFQQALRGATGPLPTADAQLLLPGRR